MISGVQQYANPEVLVETEWAGKNLDDTRLRIVEVDYDRMANYDAGHIPGAVLIDWKIDLNDPVTRDILNREQLENLLSRSGISNDITMVRGVNGEIQ